MTSRSKEEPLLNIKDIKDLLKLVNDMELAEVLIESEGFKLSIKKPAPQAIQVAVAQPTPIYPHLTTAPTHEAYSPAQQASVVDDSPEIGLDELLITSPMVGTFYRAPAPGAAPFIDIGSVIVQGQPVCIIEAMKLMNEIESEFPGRVVKVLVEDAQPVEYGQPLFVLEKV